ncbi:MAG: hypothetical protein B7X12_08055 [Halothiobacillus sp. 20-53-49]|nr:hypothetical protein [Halothiobacillaceae bacterium]OYV45657.1 MAG: hypothetical protein B7X12_08055 [Halothiobacillus sp. 20-53-49]HUN00861.1 hypothetical protein [Halothiobacillus sp.]
MTNHDACPSERAIPADGATSSTLCQYPDVICAQLRWLQRRVFYQFLQTGCPTIDLEADLDILRNQADLTQRLALPVPPLATMPPLLRGSVRHAKTPGDALSAPAQEGANAS